jgi:SAM-dependent methyltransferase
MTQDTAGFFDNYAADFDALYGVEKNPISRLVSALFRKSMRERFVRSLAGCEEPEGKAVLDIGCGPGHYCIALAKRGAEVTGIDFAPNMIDLAKELAERENVAERCQFIVDDFINWTPPHKFDYTIITGVMDYIADPHSFVTRVIDCTKLRAFFSFPIDGGFLAWQRKRRYRSRCDLYMYAKDEVDRLFSGREEIDYTIERIHRDYFVTIDIKSG